MNRQRDNRVATRRKIDCQIEKQNSRGIVWQIGGVELKQRSMVTSSPRSMPHFLAAMKSNETPRSRVTNNSFFIPKRIKGGVGQGQLGRNSVESARKGKINATGS